MVSKNELERVVEKFRRGEELTEKEATLINQASKTLESILEDDVVKRVTRSVNRKIGNGNT